MPGAADLLLFSSGVDTRNTIEAFKNGSIPNLADGHDEKGASAAGLDDDGDELGVDGAERGVPRHAGHAHVVDAVLGLPGLGEDVAELALPDHTSPERHICIARATKKKGRLYILNVYISQTL